MTGLHSPIPAVREAIVGWGHGWDDALPVDFGRRQQERYRGGNVVERSFSKLKQWRGIAMRSDKTARSYHAALCLAATLGWLSASGSSTAQSLHEHSCHAPIEAR